MDLLQQLVVSLQVLLSPPTLAVQHVLHTPHTLVMLQGSFVLDGATVPSTRATYIFTAAVPKDLLQLVGLHPFRLCVNPVPIC